MAGPAQMLRVLACTIDLSRERATSSLKIEINGLSQRSAGSFRSRVLRITNPSLKVLQNQTEEDQSCV